MTGRDGGISDKAIVVLVLLENILGHVTMEQLTKRQHLSGTTFEEIALNNEEEVN